MAKVDLSAAAIRDRLEELARLSDRPLEATPIVDMSPGAIRDRVLTLSELSAVCSELGKALQSGSA
jgi:hypothetical protein